MNNIIPGIGKRVKEKMEEQKLTQESLASLINEDRSNLNKMLKERRPFSIDHLKSLAKILEVPLSYLFGEVSSGMEPIDPKSTPYLTYKMIQRSDPSIQQHYFFIFSALEHHSKMKNINPTVVNP